MTDKLIALIFIIVAIFQITIVYSFMLITHSFNFILLFPIASAIIEILVAYKVLK